MIQQRRRQVRPVLAAVAVLALAGCAVPPTTQQFEHMVSFEAPRLPVKVNKVASIEATAIMPPDLRAFWRSSASSMEPARSDNLMAGISSSLSRAIAASDLFERVVDVGGGRPDLKVVARFEYKLVMAPSANAREIHGVLTLESVDPATGKVISSSTGEGSIGVECVGANGVRYKVADFGHVDGYRAMILGTIRLVSAMLPRLETSLAEAVNYRLDEPAREKALSDMKAAQLPDLLASSDPSVTFARERNRAIVSAKVEQLPGILRDWSTDRLTKLLVKLEQTILDLNHESEVAKDQAERAAAGNANPARIDALRGLSISYRERIDLLKAIVTPVREELANRNR